MKNDNDKDSRLMRLMTWHFSSITVGKSIQWLKKTQNKQTKTRP
jgi:hypothetical protein